MNIISSIFLLVLKIMKAILDLIEFKNGKDSKDFKFYKKEIMNFTYIELRKFYQDLEKKGVAKRCPKKCDLRQGYSKCECSGSGYIESDVKLINK